MWFQCKLILAMFLLCALLAYCAPGQFPGQSPAYRRLHESALNALEASVHEMSAPSRFRGGSDDVSDKASDEAEPVRATSPEPIAFPQAPRQAARPTSGKRQRVTPFQAKRVAAAQGWRCGCGCVDPRDPQLRGYVLDANYEIDHRVPTRWGGAHDPSNWVAVLRGHHQVKSARESSEDARRRR